MAKRRQCSGCGAFNAVTARECKDCGAEFGSYREQRQVGPTMCSFSDHGRGCEHRGVLSDGTQGDGSWFCREHWDVVQGVPTKVKGNALPVREQKPNQPQWEYKGWDMDERKVVFARVLRVIRSMRPENIEEDSPA